MADVDMKGEIPSPVLSEQKVAEKYLISRGIKKSDDQQLAKVMDKLSDLSEGEVPISASEIYDLFVEREDLRDDIVRRGKEKPATSLSLDEKKALISQGNISTLLTSEGSDFTEEIATKSHARTDEITRVLDEEFAKPGVYDAVKEDLTQQVKVRHQAREVARLSRFIEESRDQILKLARDAQVTGRSLTSMEGRTVSEYRDLTDSAQERIESLMGVQDVRFQVRYMELKQYRKELNSGGFVETPSRKKYATELEMLWSQGKKVLVTGATGTGKTELVRHASSRMFGIKPFEITGHEKMTPYELLGRTGMSEGKDVYRPSKLIQAMVAEDVQGAPFLYDEMDASPNQANIALKTLLNDGPGDTVSVQMDSDKKFFIGPNYSFTGTANVKSDKHQTRFEIDPAIVRILEPMIVSYMPPAEVWDITIASLIDRHGRLPLSREDAEKTLKDLCDASAWIQQAYLGEKVVTDDARGSFIEARGGATTGKPASLKEAVLDPGRVIGMLKGWESSRLEGKDLRTFLDDQIIRFINNENFPEDDRYYLIEIFALRGFLKGRNINEFKVHTSNETGGFNQRVFESWTGGASNKIEEKKDEAVYLSASQVVRLDPYKRFGESLVTAANELLTDHDQQHQEVGADLEYAAQLFGEDFLGPEAIEKAFGIRINPEHIPPIPFDQSELEIAKQLNQRLVLRWDRDPNGEDLTMKKLYDLLQGEFTKQGKGKILYNTDWYEKEEFFTRAVPEVKWALVTNDVIPNSTSKNYVEQTETIIDYLKNEVFPSYPIPKELSDAISQFERQKVEIANLLSSNPREAAIRLDNLSITHLTKQTPVEVLYDLLLYTQNNNKRLLPNIWTWSSARASGGYFVYLGHFDEYGLGVPGYWPDISDSNIGVCLSR